MKKTLNTIASSIAILFGICLLGLFAAIVYFKLNPPQSVAVAYDAPAPVKVIHDPSLYPLLQSVVIDKASTDHIGISYVDKTSMDTQGDYYSSTDTIEVTHIDSSLLKDVIAHEYLHHIYYRLSDVDKRSIDTVATQHYADDAGLRTRMKWYTDNKQLTPNEIISVSCTEEADGWLPQPLVNYCNKYIDRTQLTLLH